MKLLVTGGAGFIGSNLVEKLIRLGHSVSVIDNLSSGYESNIRDLDVTFFEEDVCNGEAVEKIIRNGNFDTIFHLAASVGNKRSIDHPILDSQINVIGTLNILEAARKHKVRKIVASSSAGIYGELKTVPIKEDHPIDPESPYSASKLCMEKQCLAYGHLYDMEVICLRYFNVYGKNQRFDAYGNVIPKFVFLALENKKISIYGDGEQTRDFIHVDDVVQANIKAFESHGISGAFNCASQTQITINRLVKLIQESMDQSIEVEYTDVRKGDVLHSLADISKARKALNFSPKVDIETGLQNYIHWAKAFNKN
ncbi:GDP-mannose 4,6-dehydratase [Membranihabitans marinus]|uniref:GDP-mannose 4,6-dehydratase n=1 Tax=Membranihabitans marinus TaxID=1227546 RepID=UPI001F2906E2|nr:GDP-mannose 4,6-dehydratase [Membranihabitans marinus]